MNLNEERNFLKLQETLDKLGFTQNNRALAEEYLDLSKPENQELLKKAERQDLSQLESEQQKKGKEYAAHCVKRKREEELGRFVRLVSAIGGSTAYYVLAQYTWDLSAVKKYVPLEIQIAMEAESRAWNLHTLGYRTVKSFFELAKKEPEVLKRAGELCYHQYGNAKVLLMGIYLNSVKPANNGGGILKNIFGRGKENTEFNKAVQDLETDLCDSIPNMLSNPGLQDGELKEILEFLETDSGSGFIPDNITAILRRHGVSDYLVHLLGGSAFLAMEHSKKLVSFLRLCLAAKSDTALNACKNRAGDELYAKMEEDLEKILPISKQEYLKWCVENKRAGAIIRIAKADEEVIHRGAMESTADGYVFLMNCVKGASSRLYEELKCSYSENFLEKTASELVSGFSVGMNEAKSYLLGECEIESLYPLADIWQKGTCYDYRSFESIGRMESGEPQLFRRALVLEALRLQGYFFTNIVLKRENADWKNVDKLVENLEKERLPFSYQLAAYEAVYSNIYAENSKASFIDRLTESFVKKWNIYRKDLEMQVKNGTAVGRYLCIRVLDIFWQEEKELLFSCAQDSSKMVKELLVLVYTSHKEWEQEVLALLSSKKSAERELSVLVLKKWGADQYQKQFEGALEKEKSKKLQELLKSCLGMEEQKTAMEGEKTPKELASEILKGGKKRKIAWVFETPGTIVPLKDGREAPEEYLQALLAAYADMSIPGFCQDAKKLAEELAPEKLADFMTELFDKWLEGKAEAKKKWVLYATSIHGGSKIISRIHHQIQEWPQHARGAMAAEAVKALALNGNPEALLLVDNISRKFKFRQVKTAAGEALAYAAEQMGISKAELEDKIVPGLGFGEDLSRTFDYGTRTFTVYLTPALELEVFDMDQKRLKTVPAPGKRDEEEKASASYAEFKQLKKQLKTVVTNQKLRLEQALTAERLWKTDQWETLFVKNPVMHQFAIGLIWGLYENGILKDTFRYMEDGSFNTVDEDEYELPAEGMIGLVHPVEITKEEISAWKEQLSDYEVIQPISQLDREIFIVTDEEKEKTELVRFGGKILNGLSLSGKLQGMGWYRGSVQDAGIYDTFYREDGEIGVELGFSGCYVADENEDVTVYGASFYKAGTVKRGSYVYDTIKKENLYPLEKVPARYFSEMILQLTKATASSQEQLSYPECKE